MPKKLAADCLVIGGGPAGLACALSAWENGARRVVLLERGKYLGGILNQCIHPGFGLQIFQEELTGPEYADKFVQKLNRTGIEVLTETMALDATPDKRITAVNRDGVWEITAQSVFLCMGCRERTRGMIRIPGSRPAGIFTAGLAQYLVNVEGYLPGKKAVILGSGDIGLIMARRLTLEGAQVEAVVEIKNSLSGLLRNYVQCLLDFEVPLLISHTVTEIKGKDRLAGVVVSEVDENWQPRAGTQKFVACDTLLLSVGLIPENELSKKMGIAICPWSGGPWVDEDFATDIPGVFACGNVASVFDLVDYVTLVSERAGKRAMTDKPTTSLKFFLSPGEGVNLVIPERLRQTEEGMVFIRPQEAMSRARITFSYQGEIFWERRISLCRPSEMIKLNLADIDWPVEGGNVKIGIQGKPVFGVV